MKKIMSNLIQLKIVNINRLTSRCCFVYVLHSERKSLNFEKFVFVFVKGQTKKIYVPESVLNFNIC